MEKVEEKYPNDREKEIDVLLRKIDYLNIDTREKMIAVGYKRKSVNLSINNRIASLRGDIRNILNRKTL